MLSRSDMLTSLPALRASSRRSAESSLILNLATASMGPALSKFLVWGISCSGPGVWASKFKVVDMGHEIESVDVGVLDFGL